MEPSSGNVTMNNILFENEACLVINKHCGEGGQVSFGRLPPGKLSGGQMSGQKPAGLLKPVHRLDTPASGCLLLAKTREAAAFFSTAFAAPEKTIEKRYWAIVEKKRDDNPSIARILLNGEWQEFVHWISFTPKQNKSFAHDAEKPGAKKAQLRLRLVGSGDRYLFLEIDLITGRHHQIRAQLSALGFPVKGDLKYGARRSEKSGGIRLHARSLRFPNPMDPGKIILVEAPPPVDYRNPTDSLWEAFINSNNLHFSLKNNIV